MRYTVTVEEDEHGELVLPLPQEMLDHLGWQEGDILKWIEREPGTWEIQKKN